MAYHSARRLKTLKGLPPYEFVCKTRAKESERFRINPIRHTVGLNTYRRTLLIHGARSVIARSKQPTELVRQNTPD